MGILYSKTKTSSLLLLYNAQDILAHSSISVLQICVCLN